MFAMKYFQSAMDCSQSPVIRGSTVFKVNVIVSIVYIVVIYSSLIWKCVTYPGGSGWCQTTYKILTESVLMMWVTINIVSTSLIVVSLYKFVKFAQTIKTERLLINKLTLAMHLVMATAESLIIVVYLITLD